jgi:hypothetical protein
MDFLLTFLAIGGIGWSLLRRFGRCPEMRQGSPIPIRPHRATRGGYSKSGT